MRSRKNRDPLTGKYPPDPAYERLFAQILLKAPAPIGVARTPERSISRAFLRKPYSIWANCNWAKVDIK